MKKYFIFGCIALLFTATSCSDWTEVENKNIDKLLANADSSQQRSIGSEGNLYCCSIL